MFAFMHLISGYLWNYTYCYCTMCHNLEVLYFYSCGRRFSSAVSDAIVASLVLLVMYDTALYVSTFQSDRSSRHDIAKQSIC